MFLEELIGDDLVDETALNVSDVTLGELLDSPLTDLVELVVGRAGRGRRPPRRTAIDLRELIESQIVSLADLAQAELLDLLDLDQRAVDFQQLLADDRVRRADEDLLQQRSHGDGGIPARRCRSAPTSSSPRRSRPATWTRTATSTSWSATPRPARGCT